MTYSVLKVSLNPNQPTTRNNECWSMKWDRKLIPELGLWMNSILVLQFLFSF